MVRVTSQTPVETPSLSFLIEADWGQGRLVREYSALVDAPSSALAVAEPEIVAPAGSLSNTIAREPTAAPAPGRRPRACSPPLRPVPAPPPCSGCAGHAPADGSTVQRGQTLSQIASAVARGNQVSRDRAMIALRANRKPSSAATSTCSDRGAVLRMPGKHWRPSMPPRLPRWCVSMPHSGGRRAPCRNRRPAATAATATATASSRLRPMGHDLKSLRRWPPTPRMRTTTGTAAGSEGDMLNGEQLRQAREDIATRDAEIGELKQRVADLEKLRNSSSSR